MKYNVGDKVQIKSIDWYKQMLSIPNKLVWQNKLTNDFVGIWCGSHIFKESMFEFLGKTMTIQEVGIDFYLMEEDPCGYEFNDEMIERLMEETKPKFKVGDKITNGKDTLTILTLTPDRYVAENNFGECGILYFNSQGGWKIVEEETLIERVDDNGLPFNEWLSHKGAFYIPDGYELVDENNNPINVTKISLRKKSEVIPNLQLDSIRTVREYDTAHSRIWLEIYEDNPELCIFTHLLVDEDHRRKGYGTKALEQAEIIAKDLGCDTIHLKVETNSWVHNWYLRSGYKFLTNADDNYTWLTKSI